MCVRENKGSTKRHLFDKELTTRSLGALCCVHSPSSTTSNETLQLSPYIGKGGGRERVKGITQTCSPPNPHEKVFDFFFETTDAIATRAAILRSFPLSLNQSVNTTSVAHHASFI